MEQVTSKTRIIRKLTPEIVEIQFFDNAVLTIESAIEDSRIYDEFTKKKRLKKLVIMGLYTKSDLDARKQIAIENGKKKHRVIAEAIVVKTPLIKVAVTFYQFFLKQQYPCKVFATREKALEWLEDYK